MRIDHDVQADAIYVNLSNRPYAYGRDLDDWRRIDYSVDELPIGIEILNVSEGVNLSGLPNPGDLVKAMNKRGIKAYFLDQHVYTTVGSKQNTLILAELNNNQVDIVERGESIVVFDIWFDSPVKRELEDNREVITK